MDDQALDDRQPGAPAVIGTVRLQIPTPTPLFIHDQMRLRTRHGEGGNLDLAKKQAP